MSIDSVNLLLLSKFLKIRSHKFEKGKLTGLRAELINKSTGQIAAENGTNIILGYTLNKFVQTQFIQQQFGQSFL